MPRNAPPITKRPPVSPRRVIVALVLDVVLVLAFVLIGRGNHAEGFSIADTLVTWWPFLAGLAVGWLATRAWRYPFRIVLPGIPIWLFTVAVGMLFRVVTNQGVAVSFVIVAVIVLGVFLLGWRFIAGLITSRRRGASGPTAAKGWGAASGTGTAGSSSVRR